MKIFQWHHFAVSPKIWQHIMLITIAIEQAEEFQSPHLTEPNARGVYHVFQT